MHLTNFADVSSVSLARGNCGSFTARCKLTKLRLRLKASRATPADLALVFTWWLQHWNQVRMHDSMRERKWNVRGGQLRLLVDKCWCEHCSDCLPEKLETIRASGSLGVCISAAKSCALFQFSCHSSNHQRFRKKPELEVLPFRAEVSESLVVPGKRVISRSRSEDLNRPLTQHYIVDWSCRSTLLPLDHQSLQPLAALVQAQACYCHRAGTWQPR